MSLLTEWEGRTGKYLARGHGERPDLTQSINILLYDHRSFLFFFFFRVIKFGMFTYVAHFDRKVEIYMATNNLLLTEREGRTGEYWPEVVTVRTERSEVCTKTTEGQYSPVRPEQARLVSSLLYGTLFLIVKCTSGGLHLKNVHLHPSSAGSFNVKDDNFHIFSLSWLQMLNLPALLQNKNTQIGPFPWKRSVLQNPDRERTNQSTGICLGLGLPYTNIQYFHPSLCDTYPFIRYLFLLKIFLQKISMDH